MRCCVQLAASPVQADFGTDHLSLGFTQNLEPPLDTLDIAYGKPSLATRICSDIVNMVALCQHRSLNDRLPAL